MTSHYGSFQMQETEHYFAFIFKGVKVELIEKETPKSGLDRILDRYDGEQKKTLGHYGKMVIESQKKGNGAEVIFYGTLFMSALKNYRVTP